MGILFLWTGFNTQSPQDEFVLSVNYGEFSSLTGKAGHSDEIPV